MRHFLSLYILAVLCVLQSATAGKRWISKTNAAADIAAAEKSFGNRGLPPSLRLRQTTWQEIKARQVSRTSPFYKRQMTSAVPTVYPTCSANYNGDVSVARFSKVEIVNGDSSIKPGPIPAANEQMCLQLCKEAADCVAYFYKFSDRSCYPKSSFSPDAFSTTTAAASTSGAVSGLLESCQSAATKGLTTSTLAGCCDSQMTAQAFNTCPAAYPGDIAVARYPGIELSGGDSAIVPGPINAVLEAACLQICKGTADCIAYFYKPSDKTCYPKSSWGPSSFFEGTANAQLPGAVSGILGTCNAAALSGLLTRYQNMCCDSKMGFQGDLTFETCSVTYPGDVAVARYQATEIVGGDSTAAPGPISVTTENECLYYCKGAADCIGYVFLPDRYECYPKASWSPTTFSSTSAAATSGAMSGLLGSCSAATLSGAMSSSPCCDAKMASGVFYGTCPSSYPGDIAVARYPQAELRFGESTIARGPINAIDETACLQICKRAADCVAYFWIAETQICWPKASWDPLEFHSNSVAAKSAGSVSGVLGTCAAAYAAGVTPRYTARCCDSNMSILTFPTCPATYPGDIAVARYPNIELRGGDLGSSVAANEAACLGTCKAKTGCIAYFYRADQKRCYPKSSWTSTGFYSTSAAALSAGAASGILGSCNDAAYAGVKPAYNDVCCNAHMNSVG